MKTQPKITFDKVFKIEETKISKNIQIIRELKKITPSVPDTELLELYNKSISIYQSRFLPSKL